MASHSLHTIGAIDVGSHNLHMTIAQIDESGKIEILEQLSKPTNIGSDVFTLGRILNTTLRDLLGTLKGFSLLLKGYQVKTYRAVSTSAFREAENREYVLEHIRLKTGISVDVINIAQERFLMYKALRYQSPAIGLNNFEESALVVNIASGGIEVSIYDNGSLKLTEYIKIGALRLHKTLAELQNKTTEFSQVMEEFIDSRLSLLKPVIKSASIKYFVGLGSEMNTIFRLCRSNSAYYTDKEEITALYEKVRVMLDEQLMDTFDLTAREADTFLPSVIILNAFMKMTKAKRLYVPLVVLQHGILYDLADQLYKYPRREEYLQDIISSVWYIAEKYGVEKQHSSQVAKLALSIFDQTKKLHKLGEKERQYLQIAAILHTIGYFASFSEHNILSFELIKKQSITGLSNKELDLIANVVRYHEAEIPSQHHYNYKILTPEEKITVSKLAAILKLADSLDISHSKKIEQIDISFSGDDLYLKPHTKQNILLEEWAFSSGAHFFEEVMGAEPHISHQR